MYEKNLGGELLAAVSRSFYLTLKALPKQLREPISLAYLLARTADTIADTAQVAPDVRLGCLTQFGSLIHDRAECSPEFGTVLIQDFQPLQTDPSEAKLMQRLPDALKWLSTMNGHRLQAIQGVLHHIIEGQKADIMRFPAKGHLRSLETSEELEAYTWQVAGCVGEFWTDLCFSELEGAFESSSDAARMKELGARYGKGLQLVNILRDIGKDAALGRCYLPKAEWSVLGFTEDDIARSPALLRPIWESWATRATELLGSGVEYAARLAHSRLRYATALPAILGVRTLQSLKRATDSELVSGVKIGRMDVAKLLMQVSLNNSAAGIRKLAAS